MYGTPRQFGKGVSAQGAALMIVGCMLGGRVSAAYAQPMALPYDTPTMVDGVDIVCTGIGQDARNDPRWTAYPLKVVLAGEGGQYLGEAQLNVSAEGESMMDVRCGGPLGSLQAWPRSLRGDRDDQWQHRQIERLCIDKGPHCPALPVSRRNDQL